MEEKTEVLTVWGWVCLTTGAGTAAGIAARAFAYGVREAVRRETLRVVLDQLSSGGGSVEVTDQDGVSWAVRLPDNEQE
ncbi:hypothetical protein ABZ923_00965 [Streptomyces sp. NPDC046881]|uniref:hypothetical protein n=1 Tax=Streptomyces sp. NPDC046881 TaxID=3155374 RepID=UPI00340B4682